MSNICEHGPSITEDEFGLIAKLDWPSGARVLHTVWLHQSKTPEGFTRLQPLPWPMNDHERQASFMFEGRLHVHSPIEH